MAYNKPELELFDPTTLPLEDVPGYPDTIKQRTLSRDPESGDRTRLLYFEPGTVTTEVLVHDYWEEVFIVSGELIDLTLNQTFGPGYYCCRPPGMKHGPFSTPNGCVTFEVHYYRD